MTESSHTKLWVLINCKTSKWSKLGIGLYRKFKRSSFLQIINQPRTENLIIQCTMGVSAHMRMKIKPMKNNKDLLSVKINPSKTFCNAWCLIGIIMGVSRSWVPHKSYIQENHLYICMYVAKRRPCAHHTRVCVQIDTWHCTIKIVTIDRMLTLKLLANQWRI